jgi:hypothetical protein
LAGRPAGCSRLLQGLNTVHSHWLADLLRACPLAGKPAYNAHVYWSAGPTEHAHWLVFLRPILQSVIGWRECSNTHWLEGQPHKFINWQPCRTNAYCQRWRIP